LGEPRPRAAPAAAAAIIALNVMLAALVHWSAPSQPVRSDRQEYEWVGAHAFEPGCKWSIYCYRVLVPFALEQIPLDPERRWRAYQWMSNAAAGALLALATSRVAGGQRAAYFATVIVQTSFGFAFTAYDPYTADPLVFVFAAGMLWAWVSGSWRVALILGLIGIFAKETVALVAATCLIAACARERPHWRAWIVSSFGVGLALLASRWFMDAYFGWSISSNPAAALTEGSWLALWWRNNPFLVRKLYLLFAPFGLMWLFAIFGFRMASPPLRHLALGAIVPFAALCYVQTPERALGNAFFVVVPLAALFLSRAPLAPAFMTTVLNAGVTAKIGTSTTWLPHSGVLLLPAILCGLLTVWGWQKSSKQLNSAAE
jgi:hypothetical protein